MALSLGRRLYNLTGRREPAAETVWPKRPEGRLIWLHGAAPEAAAGLAELARRLREEDGFAVLRTGAGAGGALVTMPGESVGEVRAFLDHWQPEFLLMTEGELRPALLHEMDTRRIPVAVAEAREPALMRGRDGWYPGLLREAAQALHSVFALDEAAARAWRKAGVASVERAGRLEEPSAALPCQEAERAALAGLLASRPVWLAASVPEGEEEAVIAAHRAALGQAHRLLLILVPQNPERATALAQRMEEVEGWMVAQRGHEEEPEVDIEVYVPEDAQEYGLWYRLAPVTYLGGSLSGDGALRDPMEAAALGSAILHGPRVGAYATAFGRLGAARAARAVATAADLAEALGDLLSPDRAARLAGAAWAVASEGAEVTEQVLDLIRRVTDGSPGRRSG